MVSAETMVAGLVAVAILAGVAVRFDVPHMVVLVLGGLALGFVPGTPSPHLTPDAVFLLFLPPLIYAAAFQFADEDITKNLRPIGFLALGLVLATVGAVALVGHLVFELPWAAAFVLGAVVAPTDPVAATSVIRRAGAPARLSTILEGEALVNDGSALSVFKIATAALGAGTFALGPGLLEFVWIVLGGTAIGVGAGWLSAVARRRVDEPTIEIMLALVTAYGSFLIADEIGVSGILAAVAAGLVVGVQSLTLGSPEARLQAFYFWEVTVFLVESVLFLLIGLQFEEIVGGLNQKWTVLAGYGALVIAVIMSLRLVWMFVVPPTLSLLDPRDDREPTPGWRQRLVLAYTGTRGAVTVAAALAVPAAVGGGRVADKDLIVFLAYMAVLGTLVVPALTLAPLLRRLGLSQSDEDERAARDARRQLALAALARADELEGVSRDALAQVQRTYRARLEACEPDADRSDAAALRDIRRALVHAERAELASLREQNAVPGETLRALERELDLVEARLDV